jgi:hypothetical protein
MAIAKTSSVALINLRDELKNLAKTLLEINDSMDSEVTQLGQSWRDGKYEEFVENYKPRIDKCREISENYLKWCSEHLDPTIEKIEALEGSTMSF